MGSEKMSTGKQNRRIFSLIPQSPVGLSERIELTAPLVFYSISNLDNATTNSPSTPRQLC